MAEEQIEVVKKPYSKEKIGVTIMLVGLTAAIFLAIGYWAGTQSLSGEEETAETVVPTPTTTTPIATTTTSAATSKIADELVYKNEKYGFSLTLNENWKGYKVVSWNDENTEGPAPAEDAYSFFLPSSDSNWPSLEDGYARVFVINVYLEDTYNDLEKAGLIPKKIATNNGYVFAVSSWQDAPSDLIDKELGINEILDSIAFD